MQLDNCENIYNSCACNRYPHCLDWNQQPKQNLNLICFGSSNTVVLYDLNKKQIVSILSRHTEPVNSVRWIANVDQDDAGRFIISSSVDKTCIIWQNGPDDSYTAKYILTGSTDSVIVAHSIRADLDRFVSVASSNDQSIRIWNNDQLVLTQHTNCYIFDIKLYNNLSIPGLVVLTAGSNELVNISRFNLEQNELESLISLKGHQDWIKSIDLYQDIKGTIFVASGSQDFLIRVHQIKRSTEEINLHQQSFEIKSNDNSAAINKFVVDLDTVLAGHEAWVTEVRWHFADNKLYLLSSSMDKTILLWEQPNNDDDDLQDIVWNEKVRFGEIGGNSVIGFLGCCSAPSLGFICGYSYNGAVHFWKQTDSGNDNSNSWITSLPITGHFSEVTDLTWEPSGQYFLTCSNDQTTRLHSSWTAEKTWHEIGRPQIHGYDLKCLAMAGRHKFVSGADEKVIRIFNATKYFLESIRQVSSVELVLNEDSKKEIAECAIVPALGLSNSAVYDTSAIGDEFKPKALASPPTEELLQNTLWPESQKLYGHGYEIFSIAVNHQFSLLASACKASNSTHASIIVWDLSTYKKIATLESHNLTVTQLCFSPDDQFLLSVSRDRTWALFQMDNNNGLLFTRVAFSDKRTGLHSRIIWDCAWTPDSKTFLTSSRDKTVALWNINYMNGMDSTGDNSVSEEVLVKPGAKQLTLEDSITSVDVHSKLCIQANFIACFALDNGKFFLYSFNSVGEWTQLYSFEKNWHTQTVNRVRFSSKIERHTNDGRQQVFLATCSNDKSVKLFRLTIGTDLS